MLNTLLQESLIANQKKCVFAQPSLDYLGHIIYVEGVAADPSKVHAIEQWPTPKSVKEVRGFLGLKGYYHHFVKNYGLLARPLTELLKKVVFHWGQTESDAFTTLKLTMVSLSVLAMPNFDKLFVVESNASGTGIGVVLMQEGHPIAYFSRALSSSSRLKSVYERELTTIVLAVQKCCQFLLGRHFIILTDQQSIQFIVDQRLVASDQIRWVVKLLGYDFEVQYKIGASNRVADALSRRGEGDELLLQVISMVNFLETSALRSDHQADVSLMEIIQALEAGKDVKEGYIL